MSRSFWNRCLAATCTALVLSLAAGCAAPSATEETEGGADALNGSSKRTNVEDLFRPTGTPTMIIPATLASPKEGVSGITTWEIFIGAEGVTARGKATNGKVKAILVGSVTVQGSKKELRQGYILADDFQLAEDRGDEVKVLAEAFQKDLAAAGAEATDPPTESSEEPGTEIGTRTLHPLGATPGNEGGSGNFPTSAGVSCRRDNILYASAVFGGFVGIVTGGVCTVLTSGVGVGGCAMIGVATGSAATAAANAFVVWGLECR